MQQKPNRKKESLYSKFKLWCAVHRIPTLAFPIIVLAILAILGLLVGCIITGWDFKSYITSPGGMLVGVVLLLTVISTVYFISTYRK